MASPWNALSGGKPTPRQRWAPPASSRPSWTARGTAAGVDGEGPESFGDCGELPMRLPDHSTRIEALAGRTLGPFQIVELIKRGGMAVVYKAYQPPLRRH